MFWLTELLLRGKKAHGHFISYLKMYQSILSYFDPDTMLAMFWMCVNSPNYAAGQQCCYDSTGAQVLTADSIGGSTPDRGHDWGSPPFKNPPRIPGQSHWVYDVITFYYCCLWSDNCHYYFKHRPSSDCRSYESPSSGELPTVLCFL